MPNQQHDAIIELDNFLARLRPLSWAARDWIETHVTLDQVQTWTGSMLEVAAYYIGDLVTGMLDDGLKVVTVRGRVIEQRSQYTGIVVVQSF
jgi:hypothetical protein